MDKEFELHSALFDFIPITGRHTGENLGELLFKSIVKGGTLKKASELNCGFDFSAPYSYSISHWD
jgi:hypothetical protein